MKSSHKDSKQQTPYGLWQSLITPELVGQGIRYSDVQWAPGDRERLVWCQSQGGKSTLMTASGTQPASAFSGSFNPAGGVGYGGGEFCAGKQGAVFADRDGRLYFAPYAFGSIRALTPGFGSCASPALSPNASRVAFVHTYEGRDVLAYTRLEGEVWPKILACGADFYMQPCWSPDGRALAWVEWDHPNMPWDGSRLVAVEFDPDIETPVSLWFVDGSAEVATFQPAFSPDGRYLAYLRNRGEWDELVVLDLTNGERRELVKDRSMLPPAWVQGLRTIAWSPSGEGLYFLENQEAQTRLNRVELGSGEITSLPTEQFTHIEQISVSPEGEVALIGQSPELPAEIWRLKSSALQLVASNQPNLAGTGWAPQPQPVSWQSSDGATVYGTYYAPTNPHCSAEGLPPLIVYVHGGPTSQATVGFSLDRLFFTSRGYAFLEVNYRGSTGFGRSYREALRHNWGRLDMQDTVEGAQAMVALGLADPHKLVVKGSSAGGFTVLNALIHYPGMFKAGLCSYGVSNLFTLAMDTHKFEAHYNDFLVGQLPEAAERFQEWSPEYHADQIRDPLAIFQGSADKVVPPEQSERIVERLRAKGVPYVYRLYEGEGHGFRKAETLADYYQTAEHFLREQVILRG